MKIPITTDCDIKRKKICSRRERKSGERKLSDDHENEALASLDHAQSEMSKVKDISQKKGDLKKFLKLLWFTH